MYIKLTNDARYKTTGYSAADGFQVSFLPDGALMDVYQDFSDPTKTETMVIETDEGEAVEVYKGYTELKSLALIHDVMEGEETVTVVQAFYKEPDRLQEQVTELQAAVIELAELIGG